MKYFAALGLAVAIDNSNNSESVIGTLVPMETYGQVSTQSDADAQPSRMMRAQPRPAAPVKPVRAIKTTAVKSPAGRTPTTRGATGRTPTTRGAAGRTPAQGRPIRGGTRKDAPEQDEK